MKLSINRNSISFRLASMYGGIDEYEYHIDLCTYFWSLMKGVVVVSAMIVMLSLFGIGLLILPAISVLVYLQTGYFSLDEFSVIAVVLFIGSQFVVDEYGHAISKSSAANLIGAGYRGWKEKICILVEVK